MTADQNLPDHRGHFLPGLSSEQMGRGCNWGCLPWFLRARWEAAKAGLRQLGIGLDAH